MPGRIRTCSSSEHAAFPYVKHLRGKVRLAAAPVYGHTSCDGPLKCSMIIIRGD